MTNYGFNGNDMDEAQPSIPTTANTPEQEAIIKNSTAIDSLRCQNEELLKMVQALSQALLQPSVSSQTTVPQPPKSPTPKPKPTSNIDPKRVTPPSSFSGPEDQSINGLSWIFQCTKYLERLGLLHDYGGVYEVSCLLKGPAATWYMSQETTFNRSYCTGEELLHDLKIWVTASTLASKPRDELASLCQRSKSVEKYTTDFRNIAMQIRDLSAAEALDRYKRGLNPTIQDQVDRDSPETLEVAIQLALKADRRSKRQYNVPISMTRTTIIPIENPPSMDMDVDHTDVGKNLNAWKKLTDFERNYLIRNNGCFKCRRINVNHRASQCNFKYIPPQQQRVQQMEPIDQHQEILDQNRTCCDKCNKDLLHYSFESVPNSKPFDESSGQLKNFNGLDESPDVNAADGDAIPMLTTKSSKFLFSATVQHVPVKALVDSGCTAMVINDELVRELQLVPYSVPAVEFNFANKSRGMGDSAVSVSFVCHKYQATFEMYVLQIKEQIIIGTPWFEAIICTELDWKNRILQFQDKQDGSYHTWTALQEPRNKTKLAMERGTKSIATVTGTGSKQYPKRKITKRLSPKLPSNDVSTTNCLPNIRGAGHKAHNELTATVGPGGCKSPFPLIQ